MFEAAILQTVKRKGESKGEIPKHTNSPVIAKSLRAGLWHSQGSSQSPREGRRNLTVRQETKKARHVQLRLSQLELKYWYIALYPLILTTRMKTLILDWLNPELQKLSGINQMMNSGSGLNFFSPTVAGYSQKGRIFWILLGQYIFAWHKVILQKLIQKKTSQLNLNSTLWTPALWNPCLSFATQQLMEAPPIRSTCKGEKEQ